MAHHAVAGTLYNSARPREAVVSSANDVLIDAVLRLPEAERADLAARLIESLDPATDLDAEEAWSEEIAQRLADLDAGRVATVPWKEARRQFEADGDDESQEPVG